MFGTNPVSIQDVFKIVKKETQKFCDRSQAKQKEVDLQLLSGNQVGIKGGI